MRLQPKGAARSRGDSARSKRKISRPRQSSLETLETRTLLIGTPPGQLVDAFYQDILHRAAEPGGLLAWSQALAAGVPRDRIANEFLNSVEHRSQVVSDYYRAVLGRSPDDAGLKYWVSALGAGDRLEHILASLLASPEYFARQGNDVTEFVKGVYRDVLGRPGDPAGVGYWSNVANVSGRGEVASSFVTSPEYRGRLAAGWYETYLRRKADDAGRDYWAGQLAHGATQEFVQSQFAGSPEYFSSATFAGVLTPGPAGGATSTKVKFGGSTKFQDEMGMYPVDDRAGHIGGLAPGAPGYAQAALTRAGRQVIIHRGDLPPTFDRAPATLDHETTLNLPGATYFGLYLVQDASAESFLRENPTNARAANPKGFFSSVVVNPDDFDHVRYQAFNRFSFEDLTGGGDKDFNDAIAEIQFVLAAPGDSTPPVVTIVGPQEGSTTRVSPSIVGQVVDDLSGISQIEAKIDGGPLFTVPFDMFGNFDFASLLPTDGSADGTHVVEIRATDTAGNTSDFVSRSFILDTSAVIAVDFDLAPAFDTAPVGDHRTSLHDVTLVGQTSPNVQVRLEETGATTTSDNTGRFEFTNVALVLGDNPFTVTATASGGATATARQTIVFETCDFDSTLTGWTVEEQGGVAPGKGSVTASNQSAILTEGNSFSVSLSKPFAVPSTPSRLAFQFMDLNFDGTSTGFIKDAFEAAFVDDQGRPLTPTIAPGRDAFFNITEGLPAALGAGARVSGQTVTLDLSDVPAGTVGRLILRLVNNDADTTTSVEICTARVENNVLDILSLNTTTPPPTSSPSTNSNASSQNSGRSMSDAPASGPFDAGVRSISSSVLTSSGARPTGPIATQSIPAIPLGSLPAAALSVDSRGTDFWIGFNANLHEGGQPVTMTLFITGDVATTGTVEIPGLATPFSAPFVVNPGQVTSVVLPDDAEVRTVSVIEKKGIHITAQDEVAVYGLNRELATTDAFLGLPTDSLGREYINLTYKNTSHLLAYVPGTQMLIVGTEDNTKVTIAPGSLSLPTKDSIVNVRTPADTSFFDLRNGTDSNPFVIDAPGEYTVNVTPPAQSYAGDFKFRVIDLATDATPIAIGDSATVDFPVGAEAKAYRFAATAGQSIFLDARSRLGGRASFLLVSPTGRVLYNGDTSSDSGFLSLPEAGEYFLIVAGNGTGPLTLDFATLDRATVPAITLGSTVVGDFVNGRETFVYELDGLAGQRVYFDSLTDLGRNNITLKDPVDRTLLGANLRDDQGPITLPVDGKYLIYVTGDELAPGHFAFRMLDAAGAKPITFGAVEQGTFAQGFEAALFTIHLNAGELLTYDGLDADFDRVDARIYSLTDTILQNFNADSNPNPLRIDVTGDYLLSLNAMTGVPTDFKFRPLNASAGTILTTGSELQADLDPFASRVDRFHGVAGQRVFYDSLDADFDNITASIFDPNGNQLHFANADADSRVLTLNVTGDYVLDTSSNLSTIADTRFVLRDLASALPMTLGADTQGTLATGKEALAYKFTGAVGQRLVFDGISGQSTVVIIHDPSNSEILRVGAQGDFSPVTLTENGTYFVYVEGNSPAGTSFDFRALDLATAPDLGFAAADSVTLTPGAAIALRKFDGLPGQTISFDSQAVSAGGAGTWVLYGPDNREIARAGFQGDFSAKLSLAGRHALVFFGSAAVASQTIDFQATRVNGPVVAPQGFDSIQNLSIPVGGTATYTFDAPAGQVILLDSLDSNFQNLQVAILNPDATTVGVVPDTSDLGPFLTTQAGTYTVRLQGASGVQAGDTKFRVLNGSTGASLNLGTAAGGPISEPLGAVFYSFTANVGQRVEYDGLQTDFANVLAQVVAPNAQVITQTNADGDVFVPARPFGGVHYVLLRNNLSTATDYAFRVIDITGAPLAPLDTVISGVLPSGRQIDVYRFVAAGGERLYYDGLDNDFDGVNAQLLGPGDDQVFNVNSDDDFGNARLLLPGEYRLFINGFANASADYKFRLLDLDAATPIAIGDKVQGTLGPLGRDSKVFKFHAVAGQTLFYDGLGDNSDNVRVQILDSLDRTIHESNADLDSGSFEVPVDGDYMLWIRGFSNTTDAPFAFRLRDLASATPVAFDTIIDGSLTEGFDVALYRFDALPGQTLYYNGLTTGSPNGSVEVYDSNRKNLLFRGNFREDALFTANDAGPFYLVLRGQNSTPTSFKFELLDASLAPTVPFGTDTSGVLPHGQSHVIFRFDGLAGQRILYDGLDNDNDNVTATILDPAGNFVRNMNADQDSPLLTLGTSGPHYLIISGDLAAAADFKFRLLDVADAPLITLGVETTGQLPNERYAQLYRIDGVEGRRVTLHKTLGPQNPLWYFIDPENTNLASFGFNQDLAGRMLFDGEYVVYVVGNGAPGVVDFKFQSSSVDDAALTPTGFNTLVDLPVGVHGTGTAKFKARAGQLVYLDTQVSNFAIPHETITLNAGDTYQIRDELGSNDLSGTIVTSDKPVAVFGSHLATFIPDGFFAADHIVEQLPATQAWGREFVTMPLATRKNGDTFRFLAGTDGTVLKINGKAEATLARGQFFEKIVDGPAEISSNHPILVAQYSNSTSFDNVTSDPFMMLIPPFEQFLSNYTVTTPATGFDINYINLVTPNAAVGEVEVDGAKVAANLYTPIGASGFSGVQVAVEKGTHNLTGPLPFGAFMYGYASFDSYGYPGGQSLSPVARASAISLSPAVAKRPVGVEQKLQATVTDDVGQPVAGVRVDFAVSGANPTTGFAFTDDQGVAEFSYLGAVEGRDVVQATLSNLVDESVINWQGAPSPPTISVVSPLDGSTVVAGHSIVASGVALADSPNAIVSLVTVNGVPIEDFDGAGNFFVKLFVGPGENLYEFKVEDSLGQTATTRLTLQGDDRPAGNVDFANLSDISGSFRAAYARTSLNKDTTTLYADVAIDNLGQYSADAPLFVGVTNISDPAVRVLRAAGVTPGGVPYYGFTGLVTGGTLGPADRTGFLSATFFDPGLAPFTYDLVFFGRLNDPPTIESVPHLEAHPDREYAYDVLASDSNGDTLAYSLTESPVGMTIDAATGQVRWTPTVADLGANDVTVRVVDGRGGQAEQHFVLAVTVAPPNRPPVFTTSPVVIAAVGAPYAYDADASDADFDTLTFSLQSGPAGLQIESLSGKVTWTPTAAQFGNQAVTLLVEDGNGGSASQSFTICVPAAPVPGTISGIKFFDINGNGVRDRASDTPPPGGPNSTPTVQLLQISTEFNNPVGIDYYEPNNSILVTVNYGNGQPRNFEQINADGSHTPFSNVSGLTDEVMVAVVPNDNPGGFVPGDIFVGNGIDGQIVRITNGGATVIDPWIDLPGAGNGLFRGGLTFDRTGEFGGELIAVTTGGEIWRIDASATPIKLGDVDTHLEGLTVIPKDVDRYGPLAGKIVAGAELQGRMYVIDPAGVVTFVTPGVNIEDIDIVPRDGNFFGVNFGSGKIVGAPASAFASMIGDILLTQESHSDSGLFRLFWDGTQLKTEKIPLTPNSPALGTWEQVTFAKAGIVEVPPLPLEPLLAGFVVYLDDNDNGVRDPNEPFALTDNQGAYTISNVPAGKHIVREAPRAGWAQTLPSTASRVVTLTDGQFAADIDFGNTLGVKPASINGVVFDDTDGDGIRAGAEPSLANRVIFIDANRDHFREADEPFVRADANGVYKFDNLAPGTYPLAQEVERGRQGTVPALGIFEITVAAGEVKSGVDFGSQQVGAVANRGPVFSSVARLDASIGVLYRYQARATDADGDPLFFDLAEAPVGMTVDPASGVVLWTPRATDIGSRQVVLRASDALGGVALQSFQVEVLPANSAPVFVGKPPSTAVVGAPWRFVAQAQDAEGDALAYLLVSGPAGMTIDAATGRVDWTPTVGQVGKRSVELQADDGHGGLASLSFEVNVLASATNGPPTILSTPRSSIPLGREYFYQPQVVDSDGDRLVFSLDSKPTGMTIDADSGLVAWTPDASQLGANQVTVRVSDGRGGETIQDFSVEVTSSDVNQAPRIRSTPPTSFAIDGKLFAYDLVGFDPDFDPLTWRLVSAPRGVSIDPLRGTLRWVPTTDQLGPNAITVEVSDTFLATATQTLVIQVSCANLPPAIVSRANTSAAAGERYLYALRAIDPEQQPLSFALVTGPTGMTIDEFGVLRWTPDASQVGAFDVEVTATDPEGGVGTQKFSVTVANVVPNKPPVFTSRPTFRATVGEVYSYQAAAFDPEGSNVVFSLITPPAGMTIDANTGVLSWTPTAAQAGAHLIKIAADDPDGGRGLQTFALLARVNSPPAFVSSPVIQVMAGETYHYDVQATDPDNDALALALVSGPAGMTIDNLGRIVWVTTPADLGSADVTVMVSDPHGDSATQAFTIVVSPDTQAPKLMISASATRVALGADILLTVTATDNVGVRGKTLKVAGQALTLDANGSATFHAANLGSLLAEATAADAAGNVGTASLTLRVYDPADTQGPVAQIASPQAGSVVSTLTDIIGTVTDANLAFYDLQYARADQVDVDDPQADNPAYVTFAHGTSPVTNGKLGVFDPTMLLNDNYVIRLVAEDTGGNRTSVSLPLSAQGALKLGNFYLAFTDLALPLAGVPIEITRVYDTLQANQDGQLGFGWTLKFQDANIRETIPVTPLEFQGVPFAGIPFRMGTRVYITNPEGRREGFTFSPTPAFSLFGGGYWLPRFLPDPGVFDKLEVDPTPMILINGGFHIHFLGFPYNPGLYRLTTPAGDTYSYDQFQGLQSIRTRGGDELTFTPDGITSSTGVSVSFVRDALGRISKIIDPAGGVLQYSYDAAGNLVRFTDSTGSKTNYAYLATPAHFLDTIVDPRGVQVFHAEFDADGRLASSTNSVGARLLNVFDMAQLTETTTDPSGGKTTVSFDERGNITKAVDPQGAVYLFAYDANDNVISTTDPNGNKVLTTYDARGNITQIVDPLGHAHHITYDASNQATLIVDAAGRTATSVFDAQGRLAKFINALGETSLFERDSRGRVTKSVDNEGRASTYEYGAGTRPTKATHPDGTSQTYVYNQFDEVVRETDELGHVTNYDFDSAGRPVSAKDALGNIVSYAYSNDQFTQAVDALGRITRFEYDLAGRRSKLIDPAGGVTQYVYDGNNRLTRVIEPAGHASDTNYRLDGSVDSVVDALGNKTRFEYDADGNPTATIDALGRKTRFEYDALGRLVKRIDPLGGEYLYEYDVAGNYVATTDPNGHTTRFEYDALNRLVRTIDAAGGVTRRFYDKKGRLVKVADANGHETRFEYDTRGRLAKTIDAANATRSFAYDAANNLTAVTDELGHVTRYEYDSLNRRVKSIDPLGAETLYAVNPVGKVTSITDPLGRKTQFQYDSLDRMTKLIDPAGGTTSYEFDAAGNRTSVKDPLGQTTSFEYDDLRRLTRRVDPLGNAQSWRYDAAGQLVGLTDREGQSIGYEYDANGRRVKENWLNGLTVVHTIGYAYDPAGNLLSGNDSFSKLSYQYDVLNRITRVDNDQTPNVPRVILNYQYDAVGNGLVVRDDQGTRVESTYDARNLLLSRTWQGGGVDPARVEVTSNATRDRDTLTRFSDVAGVTKVGGTTYVYDKIGQPTSITHEDALGAVLADYHYAYDLANQLIDETSGGDSTHFGYDSNGQLTSADRAIAADEAYSYDANGNRKGAGVVVQDNRVASDGEFSYAYDKNGAMVSRTNIASGAQTTYKYDHRGRLVEVNEFDNAHNPLSQVRFTYDFLDRRIGVETSSETIRTVYAGPNAWADFDDSGNLVTKYLQGTQGDEPWARFRPGEGTAWYLSDRLGTIHDLTDAAGAVQDHLEYDSFGAVTVETDAAFGDRFKFTGREFDATTGLYYYRARYYDPGMGRFISEDPAGFRAGDANLNRYVGNSPTNATDPSGLQAVNEWGATNAFSAFYTNIALSYGADQPFTFRIGTRNGQTGIGGGASGPANAKGKLPIPKGGLGAGFPSSPFVAGGSASGPPQIGFKPKIAGPFTATYGFPDKNNPNGTASIGIGPINIGTGAADDESFLGGEPDDGEFSFRVRSVAKSPNLVISANLAIYVGVAEELALIAAVASAPDGATYAEVNFAKSTQNPKASVKARGFAHFPPRGLPDSNPPPPPTDQPPPPPPTPPPPTQPPSGGGPGGGGGDGDGDGGGGPPQFFGCAGFLYGRPGIRDPYIYDTSIVGNVYDYGCCLWLVNRYYARPREECVEDAAYDMRNCCFQFYV